MDDNKLQVYEARQTIAQVRARDGVAGSLVLDPEAVPDLLEYWNVIRKRYATVLVVLVHAFLPIMVLACYVSMSRIDPSHLRAARTLGAPMSSGVVIRRTRRLNSCKRMSTTTSAEFSVSPRCGLSLSWNAW